MAVTKQKIFFDKAAASANDLLGSYLIGGTDDTVIGNSGTSMLVSVSNTVAVSATDLDIRDLTHVSDSVKVGDGTDFLAIAADGSIAVTDNGTTLSVDDGAGSLTVDAVQLDIDDLDHATDSVKIGDGTDFLAIAADGSIAVTDNGTTLSVDDGAGSLTVDAVQLDIDDLDHGTDSVKIGDGTDFLAVNADGSINVQITENVSNGAIKNSAATVSTVAQVLVSPLSGRTSVVIYNNGSQDVFLGFDNTVTSSNGLPIPKYSNIEIEADANAVLYMIAASGSQDVRFLEIAK